MEHVACHHCDGTSPTSGLSNGRALVGGGARERCRSLSATDARVARRNIFQAKRTANLQHGIEPPLGPTLEQEQDRVFRFKNSKRNSTNSDFRAENSNAQPRRVRQGCPNCPAARAKPPRLVRESSQTPVFEEAEIVAFLDSIYPNSLKYIRDKAIFCVLLYSWCRVSALIN